MVTCFSSWGKQRKWQTTKEKISRKKTSWLTLSRPSLTASFNSRSLAISTASWKDMEIIMDGKNLKRNWIRYLWSSFAPAFSCSSRSSPAFRCPVSPSARLPPTKIQAKRAMSLKLVQIVSTRSRSVNCLLSRVFLYWKEARRSYVMWVQYWLGFPPKN